MGFGDDLHGLCWRGDLSGALVSDAGRTAAHARLRPAAVAAVEKVGVSVNLNYMSENLQAKVCPKCNKQMAEGYILDEGRNASRPITWIEGKPEQKKFMGVIIDFELEKKDRANLKVQTFRCVGCGYLESYAL